MTNHTSQFYEKKFIIIKNLIYDENIDNNNIGFIIDLIKKHFGLNKFLIKIRDDYQLFKTFIIKCDIKFDLFYTIRNNIIKTCTGNYKYIYCLEYKLLLILHMINDFTNWKSLSKCIFYESQQHTKSHYKTLYRQYAYWTQKGIFKNSFFNVTPNNNTNNTNGNDTNDNNTNNTNDTNTNNTNPNNTNTNNTNTYNTSNDNNTNNNDTNPNDTNNNTNNNTNNDIYIQNDDFYNIDIRNDFFIDATFIANKNGYEDIVINPELTKKNVTKLTTISDVDGFIYSVSLSKAKTKQIIYNNKIKQINTVNHDVELIQNVLNETNPNIKFFNNINNLQLIGDKGYKTDKNFYIKKEKVSMISPDKKNQKKNMINRHQKRKLGYRFIIENTINGFKHNSRISIRKDGKSNMFMGWIYISCLSHNLKINKKKEKIYKEF